jgi:hypothetical protein
MGLLLDSLWIHNVQPGGETRGDAARNDFEKDLEQFLPLCVRGRGERGSDSKWTLGVLQTAKGCLIGYIYSGEFKCKD